MFPQHGCCKTRAAWVPLYAELMTRVGDTTHLGVFEVTVKFPVYILGVAQQVTAALHLTGRHARRSKLLRYVMVGARTGPEGDLIVDGVLMFKPSGICREIRIARPGGIAKHPA